MSSPAPDAPEPAALLPGAVAPGGSRADAGATTASARFRGSTAIGRRLQGLGGDSRSTRVAMAVTGLVCLVFAGLAVVAVHTSAGPWHIGVRLLADALVLVPAVGLLHELRRPFFSLPRAIYWAWSFVFMGLAPAYQVAEESFPWLGSYSAGTIVTCQLIVLVGHLAVVLAAELVSRSRRAGSSESAPQPVERLASYGRTRRALEVAAYVYTAFGVVFVVLMGTDLYRGRAIFIERLLEVAELPFGGTLFFLASAGAIAVPSAVLAARRSGVPVRRAAVASATITALVVTNPLLGSRFLTGSFLVAMVAAWLGPRLLTRYLPVLSIVLLIVLFPTLDVLRGNGTGAERVSLLTAEQSLVSFDFDAFEMLAREVSLTPRQEAGLPDRLDIAVAPVLRWVPILARPYIGLSGGAVVAEATGMEFTDVSMPLWGEGHLVGGMAGVVVVMGVLGVWLGVLSRAPRRGKEQLSGVPIAVAAPGSAALMFIILRGSLYEVFGYLALIVFMFVLVRVCLAADSRAG